MQVVLKVNGVVIKNHSYETLKGLVGTENYAALHLSELLETMEMAFREEEKAFQRARAEERWAREVARKEA